MSTKTRVEAGRKETDEALRILRAKNAERGSVVEIAYWTLREAIRGGDVAAGERLMEVPLAATLEMSRTPVREALRRLEAEQLIENVPRRGLVVPEVTLEDLIEIFSIREYLEGLSARLASEHMTTTEVYVLGQTVAQTEDAIKQGDLEALARSSAAFHRLIRQGARNSRLPRLISLLYDAHRSVGLHQLGETRLARAAAQHRAIFEAIRAGDVAQAEAGMRQHIREAFEHQARSLLV